MDTKVDTKIRSTQQQNQVYQNEAEFGVHSPGRRAKVSFLFDSSTQEGALAHRFRIQA